MGNSNNGEGGSGESILSKLAVKAGWKDVTDAGGGIPEYSRTDIIAALSKIDRWSSQGDKLNSAMVSYLYMREDYFLHHVVQVLFDRRKQEHMKIRLSGLKKELKPYYLPMCYMAVEEVVGGMSSVRCRSCRGKWEWRDTSTGQKITCSHCHDGMQPAVKMTARSRRVTVSNALTKLSEDARPISQHVWDKHLASLYDSLCEQIRFALCDGLDYLKMALWDD